MNTVRIGHDGHDGPIHQRRGPVRRLPVTLGLALLLVLGAGLTRAQAPITPIPESPIISAGGDHSCALRPSGAADCWGADFDGQAADQAGPFTAISAGTYHTCALTPAGAADCWGADFDGRATDQAGPFTAIAAGDYHTCALTQAGAADCWGTPSGPFARGQAADQAGPFVAISANNLHTCALTPDGAADCWGSNEDGQTADQAGPFTAISAGAFHTCALTQAGAADCWGAQGSISFGQAADQAGPFVAIGAGSFHTCALTTTGAADCWGAQGFIDRGQAADQAGPFTAIAAGDYHTCALTPDGAARCWGDNRNGQAANQTGPYGAYDPTPPTANPQANPAANDAGWNTSAVTVTWNWSDSDGSGLDPTNCPATSTSSGEGIRTLSASCRDRAGNMAEKSVEVKVDTTPPTLSPVVSPNPVPQGGTATVEPNAQDDVSSIASATCGTLDTVTPGAKTVTCTATDVAGNTATATAGYTVTPVSTPTPTAPAFPTSAVLDSFNRANGAVGTNWEGLAGTDFYRIASNRLDVQAGGPLVWKRASFGTTQEAFVTLSTVDARSPSQGVLLKVQGGSVPEAGAIAVVYDAAAKAVRVSTLRVGARTWTAYAGVAATFSNGDRLGAQVRADGTVRLYRNAQLLAAGTLSQADQAFFNPKGGKIGVWTAGASSAVLDDFGGGSVTP